MRRAIAIAAAAPWIAWAVVRTFGLDARHPVVGAMAYTPYVALSSPLPVALALLLRRRVVALAGLVAVLALGAAVVPRALAGPQPAAHGPRLVVMTANLYRGQADAGAVVRVARAHRVDVLSLQELTPDEYTRIETAGAAQMFPGRAVDTRPGAAGSAVLADRPLRAIPQPGPGHAQPEGVLRVPGAPAVRVKAVHPLPPINERRARGWQAALGALPGSDSRGDVQILAGDFNATLDHRELRRVLARGYTDAADAAGKGFVWTWPALGGRALPITIDHVLVDRRVRVRSVTIVRIRGTDHRALIADLELPAG